MEELASALLKELWIPEKELVCLKWEKGYALTYSAVVQIQDSVIPM